MFPDSSLTTSFSSPLCFFIRADVLWKLPRLTALWKTWGNFRASSPSVPQVFHRAFEIASRFQRAAWKTLRVSHSSHRTLLLDIYRPQDARNHNLPRAASGHATTILTQGVFESIATATSSRYLRMRSPPSCEPSCHPTGAWWRLTFESARGDVWIYDTVRDVRTRFTFEWLNLLVGWHPDGKQILFRTSAGTDN